MIKIFIVIIFFLSLISIWFNNNKLLARAEEGIPFYNLTRTINNYHYVWLDTQLGELNPFHQSRLPFLAILSAFQKIGLTNVQVQQLVFFTTLISAFISTYLLTKTLFPEKNNSTYIYASVFYVFNLFTLSQVLQRFIYPLIFTWCYLPLFLYLWITWIKTCKKLFLVLFLASSLLFSGAYVLVSSLIVFWLSAFILWLRHRKIIPAIVSILLWTLTNIWWIYPLVSVKNSEYFKGLNVKQNLISLSEVSKYYPNQEIILLKQSYFFSEKSLLPNIYNRTYNIWIGYVLVGIVATGLAWCIYNKKGFIVPIWLIVFWFLAKGTNPPFGYEFYSWLFETFPFTVLLRNSYEKLGTGFLLPYSILFALGLSVIKYRIIKTLLIFVIIFIYLRPYWTNQVFADHIINIPNSYSEANQYLNSHSNMRMLQLPFLHTAGIKFNWGYKGEEPSSDLFDRPSLSRTYNASSDPYPLIYRYLQSPNMYKLLQIFAVDSIVVHHDISMSQDYLENVDQTLSYISKWSAVNSKRKFDELEIYTIDQNASPSWGYIAKKIKYVDTIQEGLSMVILDKDFNALTDAFIVNSKKDIILNENTSNMIIKKNSAISYQYQIENATSPYLLILSTNYNPSWTATINKKIITDHIVVNGYANGWIVNQPGNYTVNVKFRVWPWD